MKFVTLKAPVFWHLDKGITGTFVRMSEQGAENGFVYVYYKPVNTFSTEKLEEPIKRTNIYFANPTYTDIPGVEQQICIIRTGEQGSIVENILDKRLLEENNKLRDIVKSLRLQLSTQKQISEEASSGAESYTAKINALKNTQRRSPFGDDRFGGFGNDFDI